MNQKLQLKLNNIINSAYHNPLKTIGWTVVVANGLLAIYGAGVSNYQGVGFSVGMGILLIVILDMQG